MCSSLNPEQWGTTWEQQDSDVYISIEKHISLVRITVASHSLYIITTLWGEHMYTLSLTKVIRNLSQTYMLTIALQRLRGTIYINANIRRWRKHFERHIMFLSNRTSTLFLSLLTWYLPWRNADLVSGWDATHCNSARALHTLLDWCAWSHTRITLHRFIFTNKAKHLIYTVPPPIIIAGNELSVLVEDLSEIIFALGSIQPWCAHC